MYQLLCILLHNPMTLKFNNVGHSMDWTMHFSMWNRLLSTVAYLVLRHWKCYMHFTKVWLKWLLMLWLTMYPQAKRWHWNRQSFCSTFPSTTICNWITNIFVISAAECLGLRDLFKILGHYYEGWTILSLAFDNCHTKWKQQFQRKNAFGMDIPLKTFCKCLKQCCVLTSGWGKTHIGLIIIWRLTRSFLKSHIQTTAPLEKLYIQ